jgi:hypothetical protein
MIGSKALHTTRPFWKGHVNPPQNYPPKKIILNRNSFGI